MNKLEHEKSPRWVSDLAVDGSAIQTWGNVVKLFFEGDDRALGGGKYFSVGS